MALVVLAMNSQTNEFPERFFSDLLHALLLRVRFRGYSFLMIFVACLVTCDQAFSFLFSKQKGRRIPCEQWFLQAGRYVRLGETTARRIEEG